MRIFATAVVLLSCACGQSRGSDVAAGGSAAADAGRYAALRVDGGCYDTSAVSAVTLINLFEGVDRCTKDSDCEVRPLGLTCVPSACAIAVTKNSCNVWEPRRAELERTLCFDLPVECPVVRISCATPAPTRVFCDDGGYCALAPRYPGDGGVPGCPAGGCESTSCP